MQLEAARDRSEAHVDVVAPVPGVVVSLVGEHDLSTRDDVRHHFSSEVERMDSDDIIVADLTYATYIDGSILGCLAAVEERATRARSHLQARTGRGQSRESGPRTDRIVRVTCAVLIDAASSSRF